MSVIRTQSQFFSYNNNLRKGVLSRVEAAEETCNLDLVSLSQDSLKELQGSASSDQNPWQEEELLVYSDELPEEEEGDYEVEETYLQELAQNFSSFSLLA